MRSKASEIVIQEQFKRVQHIADICRRIGDFNLRMAEWQHVFISPEISREVIADMLEGEQYKGLISEQRILYSELQDFITSRAYITLETEVPED